MTRNRTANFGIARSQRQQVMVDNVKNAVKNVFKPKNQAQQVAYDKARVVVKGVKNIAKEAYKNPGQAAKFVGRSVMANKGKAGLALGGLAAAGGLGMAGLKAIGARKKKANSLQGRLSSAMKKIGR